jgi:hypothetical protein
LKKFDRLQQENVKKQSTITLGLPLGWEGKALEILTRYERTFAARLPDGELRSRALEKLVKATVTCHAHLEALLHTIVHQVLVDYGEEQSRHYRHHVYDYIFDWPQQNNELSPRLLDQLEEILDPRGPLDETERALLESMLEDPVKFMREDGGPHQTELGALLGESHSTIGRRWGRIVGKIRALQATPDIDIA